MDCDLGNRKTIIVYNKLVYVSEESTSNGLDSKIGRIGLIDHVSPYTSPRQALQLNCRL